MTDVEVRIVRLEEALRDAIRLAREAFELASRARALGDGGGFGAFGGITALAVARADGVITARTGTTYGTGYAYFATDATSLVESSDRTEVKNVLNMAAADDTWIVIGQTQRYWVLLAVDDCDHLS